MIGSRFAVALLVLLLCGCTGLLDSDREPVRVYTLAPPSAPPPQQPDLPGIRIADVTTAPGLDTDRMLLRRDSLRLDHFASARWAAKTPALVEDYLAAALIEAGESFRLADRDEMADHTLDLQIRTFEADYRNGEPPVVRIDVVAMLRDARERRRIMHILRSASESATDNTLGSVARAFDAAMQRTATHIVDDIDTAIGNEGG
jgi:cholesterol transport system auxiliary component